MARTLNSSGGNSPSTSSDTLPKTLSLTRSDDQRVGSVWDMLIIRLIFTVVCVAAGYHFRPFGLSERMAIAVGLIFAVAVILFEIRLRRASLRRLIGAAPGPLLGLPRPLPPPPGSWASPLAG